MIKLILQMLVFLQFYSRRAVKQNSPATPRIDADGAACACLPLPCLNRILQERAAAFALVCSLCLTSQVAPFAPNDITVFGDKRFSLSYLLNNPHLKLDLSW